MTFSSPSTPSISAEQLGHDRRLHVGGDAGPAGAEDRVHLVEEHDHRGARAGLLPGPLEDQPDVPLGLADELVEQLRALDVEEVRPSLVRVLPAHGGDLLGQRVGHGLRDERLAAAGRPVEQHALRRPELVLAEQLGVQERQLDGVADLLDLPEQATDVGVVDVGHLLQHEVLDLGLGHPLVGVARLGVDQQRVARLERESGSSVSNSGAARQTTRSSSACPTTSARPPVPSAAPRAARRPRRRARSRRASTTVSASFSRTVWPLRSVDRVDRGRDRDPHAPAGGEHVDRLVGEPREEDAVAARRLGEPVDLLAERDELAARLLAASR